MQSSGLVLVCRERLSTDRRSIARPFRRLDNRPCTKSLRDDSGKDATAMITMVQMSGLGFPVSGDPQGEIDEMPELRTLQPRLIGLGDGTREGRAYTSQ